MFRIPATIRLASLLVAATAYLACGALTEPGAKTAQEFVAAYSGAYRSGDVDAIVSMTELAEGQTEESFRDEVRKDLDSRGFGYQAWAHTTYVGEADHGSYLRVDVEVQYARSAIVLVKRDGLLKVVQNPSAYE